MKSGGPHITGHQKFVEKPGSAEPKAAKATKSFKNAKQYELINLVKSEKYQQLVEELENNSDFINAIQTA